MKNHRRTLSASTLVNDHVVDKNGEEIGILKEIMIDMISGRIAYFVISFDGFLSISEKLFAFPYDAVQVDEKSKKIIVAVSKEKLEMAPGFDPDNWPDETKFDLTEVYNFYKIKPYWDSNTENKETKDEERAKENMENEGDING